MLESLKASVCRANLDMVKAGLVTLTWGNASGVDRETGLMVIKPSGLPYGDLRPGTMVLVDPDGKVVEGDLSPSSDTETHLALYRAFAGIGAVAHVHSEAATAFAQARREIPCLGTTHADHFRGPVPVTRPLTEAETAAGYERAAGEVIVERFRDLDPLEVPAVLAAGHAPFTWGRDVNEAVANAVALEAVARMALHTFALAPDPVPLEPHLQQKHYRRKHGPDAYYGQKPSAPERS